MYALQTLYDEFITELNPETLRFTSKVSSEEAVTFDTYKEAQAMADRLIQVAVVEL